MNDHGSAPSFRGYTITERFIFLSNLQIIILNPILNYKEVKFYHRSGTLKII